MSQPSPQPRIAYKVSEAARLFGVHRRTILRWINNGNLRLISIPGSHRLIDARSVDEIINGGLAITTTGKIVKARR